VKAQAFSQLYLSFQNGTAQAVGDHRNSNFFNILPLTTLRTIDLEGKKNSAPLFSRFCVKFERFF
jgi:hypothetical protein